MRLWSLLILLSLVVVLTAEEAAPGRLNFEGEELRFELKREGNGYLWSLEGDYYFSNTGTAKYEGAVFFPVPQRPGEEGLRGLELALIEADGIGRVSLIKQNEEGFSFRLELEGLSFAKVRIAYAQLLSGPPATYVVSSTRAWGRPLPFSRISIGVCNNLEVHKLPFVGATVEMLEDKVVYSWDFLDFWPESELILSFGDRESSYK